MRAKLALKALICSLYDGDVVLGETMAAQIQTIGRIMPLAEVLARLVLILAGAVCNVWEFVPVQTYPRVGLYLNFTVT